MFKKSFDLAKVLAYPEIGDANFKGTLWTIKRWLALKLRVRYGISIVLLLTSSYKALSGYGRYLLKIAWKRTIFYRKQ